MTIWLVLSALLVVAVVLFEIFGGRPVIYRGLPTPEIRELLEVVYVRGMDGCYLHIKSRNDKSRALRTFKRIVAMDHVMLDVALPKGLIEQLGSARLASAVDGYGAHLTARNDPSKGWILIDSTDQIDRAVVIVERLADAFLQTDLAREGVAHVVGAHGDLREHPGFTKWPR